MDYMLVILNRRGGPARDSIFPDMRKYSAELARQGAMRSGAPLRADGEAVRVRVRNGAAQVVDGPFAETKEVVGGYLMLEAASFAEALELAKRCPAARVGPIELHEAGADRESVPPAGGTRYMLLFLEGPDFEGDPDGSKYEQMTKWTDELRRERKYVECAGLPKSGPSSRIEVRGEKLAVSDGPFAESKEVVGGYALVDAQSRAEAIEIARRCPAAHWGDVELREVLVVPAA